jgi:hypothetical protein
LPDSECTADDFPEHPGQVGDIDCHDRQSQQRVGQRYDGEDHSGQPGDAADSTEHDRCGQCDESHRRPTDSDVMRRLQNIADRVRFHHVERDAGAEHQQYSKEDTARP